MLKYEVIIYWSSGDKAFIAEVPELSGCMADGATYHKALKNVVRGGIKIQVRHPPRASCHSRANGNPESRGKLNMKGVNQT